jgi:hypothetical protein
MDLVGERMLTPFDTGNDFLPQSISELWSAAGAPS